MNKINPWTTEDLEFLKTNYPLISNAKIAKHLKRTPSAIATKAFRMKLERPIKNNKGQFKPAHNRSKTLPINSTIEISSAGYPVILIKTETGWQKAHRVIWERNNGPIPNDMSITFKDGNSKNIDLSNLLCLNKKEINSYYAKLKRDKGIKIKRTPKQPKIVNEEKPISLVTKAITELKSSGLIRVYNKELKCEYWLTPEQKLRYDEKQRQKETITEQNNK